MGEKKRNKHMWAGYIYPMRVLLLTNEDGPARPHGDRTCRFVVLKWICMTVCDCSRRQV